MKQLLSRQFRKLLAKKAGVPFEPIDNYVGNGQYASYKWNETTVRGITKYDRVTKLHTVNPALMTPV